MRDPFTAAPTLRLGAERPITTAQALADAKRDLENACLRYTEAFAAHRRERLQSQPIATAGMTTSNDFWDCRHRSEPRSLSDRMNVGE